MNKYKVLIVDDEHNSIGLLSDVIAEFERLEIIGIAENGRQAIQIAAAKKPDLIFLDIGLPDITGIEVAVAVREMKYNPDIIFVTAYNQFAVDAFKVAAFNYLLKPVDHDQIINILHSFLNKKAPEDLGFKMDQLMLRYNARQKIKFATLDGFVLINPDDIIYFEAEGSYTTIHLVKGSTQLLSLNLGYIEKQLAEKQFYRISRSQIINLDYLLSVNRRLKTCTLDVNDAQYTLSISKDRIKLLELKL